MCKMFSVVTLLVVKFYIHYRAIDICPKWGTTQKQRGTERFGSRRGNILPNKGQLRGIVWSEYNKQWRACGCRMMDACNSVCRVAILAFAHLSNTLVTRILFYTQYIEQPNCDDLIQCIHYGISNPEHRLYKERLMNVEL